MHLSGSQWLFLTITLFFPFLKIVLNGLKQLTSKDYKAWDVWARKVTIFKPNSYACAIVFNITCDPCSSTIKRCWLDWKISPRTNFLKNDKKKFVKKRRHPCLGLHCHTCTCLTQFDVVILDLLISEDVKTWQVISYCINNTVHC